MYSQCPHCLTILRVTPDDLARGRGEVICGSCEQAFDALATVTAELPPEPITYLYVTDHDTLPPRLDQVVLRPQVPQVSLFEVQPVEPEAPDMPDTPLPEFVLASARRETAPGGFRPSTRWLAVAALSLLLVAQVVYAERTRLLEIPTYRAWAERGCALLGCELAVAASGNALALVSRDIRKHPNIDDALLINAIIANRSGAAQPFPILELRLADLDERPVAMRRFLPRDYLADPDRAERGMAAGTTLPVEFEVVDPGSDAVNFEFRLLP